MSGSLVPFHEEGEPERLCDPVEPMSPETIRALGEYGIEFPIWQPNVGDES